MSWNWTTRTGSRARAAASAAAAAAAESAAAFADAASASARAFAVAASASATRFGRVGLGPDPRGVSLGGLRARELKLQLLLPRGRPARIFLARHETQNAQPKEGLGERAGFGGKYVGEVEKGLRDVPLSTLRAIVESGLGLQLEAVFDKKASRRRRGKVEVAVPRDVEITSELIAALPMKVRRPLLALASALKPR